MRKHRKPYWNCYTCFSILKWADPSPHPPIQRVKPSLLTEGAIDIATLIRLEGILYIVWEAHSYLCVGYNLAWMLEVTL